MTLTLNRVLFIVAAILFLLAAIPIGIDAPLVAIGLFFLALGHAL